jgi:hypothetical protein
VVGHGGLSENVLVLPVGPVGHLVVAEGEVGARQVVLDDEGILLKEFSKAELILFDGAVRLGVFAHELLELEVVGSLEGGSDAGKGSEGERFHLKLKIIVLFLNSAFILPIKILFHLIHLNNYGVLGFWGFGVLGD